MNFLQRQAKRASLPPDLQAQIKRGIDLVGRATNEAQISSDWGTIMEIVDLMDHAADQDVREEIVRALRKRLQEKSTRVILLALDLSEALVKNCDIHTHREIATEKFMGVLARLARTYTAPGVIGRERLQIGEQTLDMIQSWGETFLPQSASLPLFARTYHELRKEGLRFKKQYDETRSPVLTPSKSVDQSSTRRSSEYGDSGGGHGHGGRRSSSHSRSRLSQENEIVETFTNPRDVEMLTMVDTSASMLEDMLYNAKSLEELTNNDVWEDILMTCMNSVKTLTETIENKVINDPEANLEPYFTANDKLQTNLQTFENIKEGIITLPLPPPIQVPDNINLDSNSGESDLLGFGSGSDTEDQDGERKTNSNNKNGGLLDLVGGSIGDNGLTSGSNGMDDFEKNNKRNSIDIDENGNNDDNIFNFKSQDNTAKENSTSIIPVLAPSRRDSNFQSNTGSSRRGSHMSTRGSSLGNAEDILDFSQDLDVNLSSTPASNSISSRTQNDATLTGSSNALVDSMGAMKIKLKSPPTSGSSSRSSHRNSFTNRGPSSSGIPFLPPPRESPKITTSPLKSSNKATALGANQNNNDNITNNNNNNNNNNKNTNIFDFLGNDNGEKVPQAPRTSTISDQTKQALSSASISSSSPFDTSNLSTMPITSHGSTLLETMNSSGASLTNSSKSVPMASSQTLPPQFPVFPSSSSTSSRAITFPMNQNSSFQPNSNSFNAFPSTGVSTFPSHTSSNAFDSDSNNMNKPFMNTSGGMNTKETSLFPNETTTTSNTLGSTAPSNSDPFATSFSWQHSQQQNQQQQQKSGGPGNSNPNTNVDGTFPTSNPFDLF